MRNIEARQDCQTTFTGLTLCLATRPTRTETALAMQLHGEMSDIYGLGVLSADRGGGSPDALGSQTTEVGSTCGAVRLLLVGSARGSRDWDHRAHVAPTRAPVAPRSRRGAARGSCGTCRVGVVRESSPGVRFRLGVRGLRLGNRLRVRRWARWHGRGGLAVNKTTPPERCAASPARFSVAGRRLSTHKERCPRIRNARHPRLRSPGR
jgi:hypothetical protein